MKRALRGLPAVVWAAGMLFGAEASGQPLVNPTVGGPYGSRPTYVCSDLGGSFCYSPDAGSPISAGSAVLPYLDNAARNWGCSWSLAANAPASLGGGNWSKWYGSETDPASGCGLVYWNYAQQAAYFLASVDRGGNVAAAAQGATATASSTFNSGTPASSLIDGNRKGSVWGTGGGWSSLYNPTAAAPQWVQVNLSGTHIVQEVDVTTLQDNYASPVEPMTTTAFTTYGIRNYAVQSWNGSAWTTVASVVGNDKVFRRFTFSPVATSRIRVTITAALQGYARVVEVEAYEAPSTSSRLLSRYIGLGQHGGGLGYPISNPTGFGWTGTTYQQFTRGLITFVSGRSTASYVGGTAAEDKALADRFALRYGISPTAGPAISGLTQDAGCTNDVWSGCGRGTTGRYVEWLDTAQAANEMIVARKGSPAALYVPAPIRAKWVDAYGSAAPWNGELGFPVTDLLPTGSLTYHQEFEKGSILWEPSGCSAGAYAARIVSQFRRPIFDSNLSMLCESVAPPNDQLAPTGAAVPFSADGTSGTYAFRPGFDDTGWFQGVRVSFDGGSAFDVTGPLYSAWIGGADGGGSVADALSGTGTASGWGPPIGNATCSGNPCTLVTQAFAHGVASFPFGGEVGFVPDPGLTAPKDFGPIGHGYLDPPPPADPRTPITHRSRDFIRLVWRNQSTLPGVTTRLYRSVTPLGGSPGPWQLVTTYDPPTLEAGTFTVYVDGAATTNARNCYYLNVSNGFTSTSSSEACAYTLDGNTVDAVDRSAPHGVGRAELRIEVPTDPPDSATLRPVGVALDSLADAFEYNFTYLDSTDPDFTLGSNAYYDLLLTAIHDVADITGIHVTSYRDNLRVKRIQLWLDNKLVFSKAFDPPALVSNSDLPGGRALVVGFDELRSNPLWGQAYVTEPLFRGFKPEDFKSKLDGILGNAVLQLPGAEYYGSRLEDGHPTVLTKPAGYGQDRLHVRQHITASSRSDHGPAYCTLDYDLRITARDINGQPTDPLNNGPSIPGSAEGIVTTEVKIENPNVDCSSTFWKNLVDDLVQATPFPSFLSKVESDIQAAIAAQAPSALQSAPPPFFHFCFPGEEDTLQAEFRNGGFTACAE